MTGAARNQNKRKRRVNMNKWRGLGVLLGLALLLIVNFQNCAPSQMAGVGSISSESEKGLASGATSDDSQPVSVIDPTNTDHAVSFKNNFVEIHPDVSTLTLLGVCDPEQEGAVLAWRMKDSESGEDFANGYESCEEGGFKLTLDHAQEIACGVDFTLTAYLGAGEGSALHLVRRCVPEMTSDASAMVGFLSVREDSKCQLEKSGSSKDSCEVVCYSKDGLVEAKQDADSASCEM